MLFYVLLTTPIRQYGDGAGGTEMEHVTPLRRTLASSP